MPLAEVQEPAHPRLALRLVAPRLAEGPPAELLLLVGQRPVERRRPVAEHPAEQLVLHPALPRVVLALLEPHQVQDLPVPLAALAQTPDSKSQAALTTGTAEETKLPISAASDNPGILNLDAFKCHFERFAIRRHFHRHFAIDQLIVNQLLEAHRKVLHPI